jgi:hypothetical protein
VALVNVTFGKRAQSVDVNQVVGLLKGTSGFGDAVFLTQYANAANPALTIRHRVSDAEDYKALLVQDKDAATIMEISGLGGGGPYEDVVGVYINPDKAKFVVGDTRNWLTVGDSFFNRVRTDSGETGSFVPVQMAYVAAAQPPYGFGSTPGPTNLLPDDVTCHFYAEASNTIAGASQNADMSLRAYEAICIQMQNTGKRSMAAATMGMHTAVNTINYLDNPASHDDFFGSCGIIMLTQDSSGRPGFGTNVAPNVGFWVGGAPTWKFGYAYTDGSNNRLFTVDSGGTIRHRGNHQFEPGVTGHRIVADLSNATDASRFMFETNVADGTSDVGVKPVGTGNKGAWTAWDRDDIPNAAYLRTSVSSGTGTAVINAAKNGSATVPLLYFQTGSTDALIIDRTQNVRMPDAGLATTATAGFFYIPSGAGAPTGVPSTVTGTTMPMYYDRTNDYLYFYNGSWKKSTVYA